MKKTGLLMVLILSGSFVQAGMFDNEVSAVEITQALAECPGPVASLGSQGRNEDQYVSSVSGEHKNLAKGVDQKTYTIMTQVGGEFGGAPAETVATLTITATVTQSGSFAPASVAWKCRIE